MPLEQNWKKHNPIFLEDKTLKSIYPFSGKQILIEQQMVPWFSFLKYSTEFLHNLLIQQVVMSKFSGCQELCLVLNTESWGNKHPCSHSCDWWREGYCTCNNSKWFYKFAQFLPRHLVLLHNFTLIWDSVKFKRFVFCFICVYI